MEITNFNWREGAWKQQVAGWGGGGGGSGHHTMELVMSYLNEIYN